MCTFQHWITVAHLAGRPAANTEVPGSKHRGGDEICFFFEKWLVSKIASTFKTHVRLFFQNEQTQLEDFCMHLLGGRSRNSQTFGRSHYSLKHWGGILLFSIHKSALYLFQVSSGDFTTVKINALQLNEHCVAAKQQKKNVTFVWVL